MDAFTTARVALLCLVGGVAAGAQAAPGAGPIAAASRAASAAASEAGAERGEPAVQLTVIEDEGSRIDELRVRGQTQRITVTPKGRAKALAPYEIIAPGGSQDLLEAPLGGRGAAGKRVWRVLSF